MIMTFSVLTSSNFAIARKILADTNFENPNERIDAMPVLNNVIDNYGRDMLEPLRGISIPGDGQLGYDVFTAQHGVPGRSSRPEACVVQEPEREMLCRPFHFLYDLPKNMVAVINN